MVRYDRWHIQESCKPIDQKRFNRREPDPDDDEKPPPYDGTAMCEGCGECKEVTIKLDKPLTSTLEKPAVVTLGKPIGEPIELQLAYVQGQLMSAQQFNKDLLDVCSKQRLNFLETLDREEVLALVVARAKRMGHQQLSTLFASMEAG